VLWLGVLAVVSFWKSSTLLQVRALLMDLGSTLGPVASMAFIVCFAFCGFGLVAAASGIILRRAWGQRLALGFASAYLLASQVYVWFYARTGLLVARRWVLLAGALFTLVILVGTLTWHKSSEWLGLV
jgi:hypothetical protein